VIPVPIVLLLGCLALAKASSKPRQVAPGGRRLDPGPYRGPLPWLEDRMVEVANRRIHMGLPLTVPAIAEDILATVYPYDADSRSIRWPIGYGSDPSLICLQDRVIAWAEMWVAAYVIRQHEDSWRKAGLP